MAVDADELFQQAEGLDKSLDFAGAFRTFLAAANTYRETGDQDKFYLALMRAGTAIAKSEGWRTQAAMWERLAAQLGLELDPTFPHRFETKAGQNGMYHVVSHEEWGEPQAKKDRTKWLSHRRALAYKWAADNLTDERQLVLAARLFRKAGSAWERAELPVPPFQGVRDDEFRQPLETPNHWREAARCYLRAAASALRTSDWETYDRVHEAWQEEELEWGVGDPATSPIQDPLAGSDLERARRCWEKYRTGIITAARYVNVPGFKAETYYEEARQLAEIQRLYASRGDRHHAREIERVRQQLRIRAARVSGRWISFLLRTLYDWLTLSGTSSRRTILWAGILNLVLLPLYYLMSHSILWADTRVSVGWPEAVTFSAASALSLSVSQYVAVGLVSSIIQTGQALVGYVVLGYILWLFLRSYEE